MALKENQTEDPSHFSGCPSKNDPPMVQDGFNGAEIPIASFSEVPAKAPTAVPSILGHSSGMGGKKHTHTQTNTVTADLAFFCKMGKEVGGLGLARLLRDWRIPCFK